MDPRITGPRAYFEAIREAAELHHSFGCASSRTRLDNALLFAQEQVEERLEQPTTGATQFIGPTILNGLGLLRAELANPDVAHDDLALDVFDLLPDLQAMFLSWDKATTR